MNDSADFDPVLQATYDVADVLRPLLARMSDSDPLAPLSLLHAEIAALIDACGGDRLRAHSDDDFDAIVNAGLELFRGINTKTGDPAALPPELRDKCKALLQACIKADLISLHEM